MSKFHWFLTGLVISGVWSVITLIIVVAITSDTESTYSYPVEPRDITVSNSPEPVSTLSKLSPEPPTSTPDATVQARHTRRTVIAYLKTSTALEPTIVRPTSAESVSSRPIEVTENSAITLKIKTIDLWLDTYQYDIIECARSGRIDWKPYGEVFDEFASISGSVSRDLQDGTLDEWDLGDVTYVLDSFADVAEDINYRCGLTLTDKLVYPDTVDQTAICVEKAWKNPAAFSRLTQSEQRRYLEGDCS